MYTTCIVRLQTQTFVSKKLVIGLCKFDNPTRDNDFIQCIFKPPCDINSISSADETKHIYLKFFTLSPNQDSRPLT